MMTLDEAWNWYTTTRMLMQSFRRLGEKHWDALPWEGPLGQDDKLQGLSSEAIIRGAGDSLAHLDDFAILILFSVFESSVRDRVLEDIRAERGRLGHALLIQIVDGVIRDIEQGSFHRILEVYKIRGVDLVEGVNQVRRYRNWVAHGRRKNRPDVVEPEMAYRRLTRFLETLVGPDSSA